MDTMYAADWIDLLAVRVIADLSLMFSIDDLLRQKSAAERLSDGLVHLKAKPPNGMFRWEGVVSRSGIATAVNNVIRPKVNLLPSQQP